MKRYDLSNNISETEELDYIIYQILAFLRSVFQKMNFSSIDHIHPQELQLTEV